MRSLLFLFIAQIIARFFAKKKEPTAQLQGENQKKRMPVTLVELLIPFLVELLFWRFSNRGSNKKLAGI